MNPRYIQIIALILFIAISTPVTAQDSPAHFISLIENGQSGDGDYDQHTLSELMDEFDVPGLSVAVIKSLVRDLLLFRFTMSNGFFL